MNARTTVVLVLMKGHEEADAEADATVDVLRRNNPEIKIKDQGTYWHLEAEDEIVVDLELVSKEIGRELSLAQWLVIMSSYVGRIHTEPDSFMVTSRLVEIEPET